MVRHMQKIRKNDQKNDRQEDRKLKKMAVQAGKSSPNHPSPAKRHRIEKRQFLSSWKTEFPWVVYDHVDGIRCQHCIDSGKTNVFTKGCDKFKKDALTKHAHTVDHSGGSWLLLQP